MGASLKLIYYAKKKESGYSLAEKDYLKRIKRYTSIDVIHIKSPKTTSKTNTNSVVKAESELLFSNITDQSFVILLDEGGKEYGSIPFAKYIEKLRNHHPQIVFVIGGAYGFAADVYTRANAKMSLSSLTFPHEIARLVFIEQLYRAFSILNNEKYHHE